MLVLALGDIHLYDYSRPVGDLIITDISVAHVSNCEYTSRLEWVLSTDSQVILIGRTPDDPRTFEHGLFQMRCGPHSNLHIELYSASHMVALQVRAETGDTGLSEPRFMLITRVNDL